MQTTLEHKKTLFDLLTRSIPENEIKSDAERYYEYLTEQFGINANEILETAGTERCHEYPNTIKHALYIIKELPIEKRFNLDEIILTGLSHPDIEVQDFAVQCIESWEDKRYILELVKLRKRCGADWLGKYINEVIKELEGTGKFPM